MGMKLTCNGKSWSVLKAWSDLLEAEGSFGAGGKGLCSAVDGAVRREVTGLLQREQSPRQDEQFAVAGRCSVDEGAETRRCCWHLLQGES